MNKELYKQVLSKVEDLKKLYNRRNSLESCVSAFSKLRRIVIRAPGGDYVELTPKESLYWAVSECIKEAFKVVNTEFEMFTFPPYQPPTNYEAASLLTENKDEEPAEEDEDMDILDFKSLSSPRKPYDAEEPEEIMEDNDNDNKGRNLCIQNGRVSLRR